MTLSTRVLIRTTRPPMTVHSFANDLLHAPAEVRKRIELKNDSWRKNEMGIWNPIGVGLTAWLISHYQPDGPIQREVEYDDYKREYYSSDEEHAAAIEEAEADPTTQGWGTIELDFDTAYGAGRYEGWGCADLHAYLITKLVDEFGVDNVKWQNEFTGDWFSGLDGFDGFGDPVKGEIPLAGTFELEA